MLSFTDSGEGGAMGGPTSKVCDVRVVGPLAPFAEGLKAWLAEAGYTPLSSVNELRWMGHLSRWLEKSHVGVADLNSEQVERYFSERRDAGLRSWRWRRASEPLLEMLTDMGLLPAEEKPVPLASPVEMVLGRFRCFLVNERALAACTADAYVFRARRFLSWCAVDGDVTGLVAADVIAAVRRESSAVTVGSTQMFVAALRSFLRFCFIDGLMGSDLSAAALAVTGRRRSSLPRGIARSDADALLRACDRRRGEGRRDHAVLLVLLRLGLRSSEVAILTLDDIDWQAGELVVHGKGRRVDRLPLPVDVGEAVAGYLKRGRPTGSDRREVFLRALAPIGPLGRGGISSIVRRACTRAGLPEIGSHRLRHTVACEMVAAGVPLAEIGQVLRHASTTSTAIYARVDVDALRRVAQPWPGGEGR